MKFDYYWNDVPGVGLCRNNLIYTSLVNEDYSVFVQWYYNDKVYHQDQNQVVNQDKMDEKWEREVKYLTLMTEHYPNLVPEILDIDYNNKKLFLKIDGKDFWNRAGCITEQYNSVLKNWQEQITEIVSAHNSLGLWKYSMHPSSFFLVNGQLKSINYFFTYHKEEAIISLKDVESHIHSNRRNAAQKYLSTLGIKWNEPQLFSKIQQLVWESFRTNYPDEFIDNIIPYNLELK